MSRWLSVAFTAAMLLLSPMGAKATPLEYDFNTTSTTGTLPLSYGPVLMVDSSVLGTSLKFTSTCPLSPPFGSCSVTGSEAGFISLTDASTTSGVLALDLAFLFNGMLAGSITNNGLVQNLTSSGNGSDWSGTLLSDRYSSCGVQSPCTFTGYWLAVALPVPEPSSFWLFAVGLLGLVLVRAQRVEPSSVRQRTQSRSRMFALEFIACFCSGGRNRTAAEAGS
jgi:hypothetical protein